MTTLNSNWQEIYRTSKNTGYGNQYVIFYAYATENIADNTSTVHTLIRTTVEGSGNYVSVSSWSAASDTQSTSGGSTVWYAGNDYNLLESAWTVSHNADGTGSVSIGMAFYATFNITSVEYRVTVGLQTIPRASQPSLNTGSIECNDVNAFTIYTNRASGSFTHTLTYGFGSASGPIATGVGDSVSWTPLTSLLNQIPNNSSGTGTIYCKTYSGSTKIGDTKTVNFTLTANTFVPIIQNMTVAETSTLVGTSADYTVDGISKKIVSANVTAQAYSTISSAIIFNNGVNVSGMDITKQPFTGWEFTSNSGNYVVQIIDSRGLASTATINQTEYKYYAPYVTSSSLVRTEPTESTGTLSVAGKWFNLASNTLSLTSANITDTNTGTVTTISPTFAVSGDSFTISAGTDVMNMLTYTDAFVVNIVVTDYYSHTANISVSLASAEYALAVGKETVLVKGNLLVNGKNVAVPEYAEMNTETNFLHIKPSSEYFASYERPEYFGSESPASTFTNTPYGGKPFYGYRIVCKNIDPTSRIAHLITVELHEQYPVPGRIWANTYDSNTKAWYGWKVNAPLIKTTIAGTLSAMSGYGVEAIATLDLSEFKLSSRDAYTATVSGYSIGQSWCEINMYTYGDGNTLVIYGYHNSPVKQSVNIDVVVEKK